MMNWNAAGSEEIESAIFQAQNDLIKGVSEGYRVPLRFFLGKNDIELNLGQEKKWHDFVMCHIIESPRIMTKKKVKVKKGTGVHRLIYVWVKLDEN